MLFFKPEALTDDVTKFIAYEDDAQCGFCLLKSDRNFAEVYEIDFNQDRPYLVEGLLRSAYNYASLKNIYMGKCTCKNIGAFLDRMNFEKTDEGYVNDIPTILMGSCCK
ncbi:MAG: hypothetical protein IKK60_06770 [Clostridia bacterium]|nr:hypothetical protein [Clostridia bacterium]